MSKQSEFDRCLMSQLGAYRKRIYGEEFFAPKQKELFPGLKRDLIMETEDVARSDDPLEACMERRGYKPTKTQLFQEAIAAKMTVDMFGKQDKLTGAEAMFQEQMQECLDRMKTRPKLKFGAAPTGTEPYMKDSPISKELQHRFEQTTFYPYDMNKEFNDSVSAKENETIDKLKTYGITEIPEDIKTALAYHRKALYEWLVTKANQVPGPMITGPSKYNYNKLEKSLNREDKSYNSLETSREYIIQAIKRAIKGRSTVTQTESRNKWKAEALITPKREFADRVFQSAYDKAGANLRADYDAGVFVKAVKNKARQFHKELIEEALREGLEVSPSVKKDYPEKFGLEKPQSKPKSKPDFNVEKELAERQRISTQIAEEWSRPARERIEAAAKRIEERKTSGGQEWKAKHSATQMTIPGISQEQFRLFGLRLTGAMQ